MTPYKTEELQFKENRAVERRIKENKALSQKTGENLPIITTMKHHTCNNENDK